MVDKMESKQEVVARYRTKAIIAATRAVIAESGPEFTLDRVAEEAGVAKGTLYLYFPSKDELVFRVLKEDIAGLLGKTREALEQQGPLLGRMRQMVHDQFKFVNANRNIFLYYRARMGQSEHAAQKDFQCRMKEEYDQYIDLMTRHFERAMAAGEIRKDMPAERIRDLILGGIEHACMAPVIFGRTIDVDTKAEQLGALIFEGIVRRDGNNCACPWLERRGA